MLVYMSCVWMQRDLRRDACTCARKRHAREMPQRGTKDAVSRILREASDIFWHALQRPHTFMRSLALHLSWDASDASERHHERRSLSHPSQARCKAMQGIRMALCSRYAWESLEYIGERLFAYDMQERCSREAKGLRSLASHARCKARDRIKVCGLLPRLVNLVPND